MALTHYGVSRSADDLSFRHTMRAAAATSMGPPPSFVPTSRAIIVRSDPPWYPSLSATRAALPCRPTRTLTVSGQLSTSPLYSFSPQASLVPTDPERASHSRLTHTPPRRSATGQGSVSVSHDRICRPVGEVLSPSLPF
ncbi:hypothetical protein M6B38_223555 [Iris pallida]|uniref:Uncharacterized protein n=1 Tax=Iris pallida TaxID=29817 RepID=A0AAX6DVY0_IRIPA|nr:hypothetical protein M6B38_223555 [Iris pallida]